MFRWLRGALGSAGNGEEASRLQRSRELMEKAFEESQERLLLSLCRWLFLLQAAVALPSCFRDAVRLTSVTLLHLADFAAPTAGCAACGRLARRSRILAADWWLLALPALYLPAWILCVGLGTSARFVLARRAEPLTQLELPARLLLALFQWCTLFRLWQRRRYCKDYPPAQSCYINVVPRASWVEPVAAAGAAVEAALREAFGKRGREDWVLRQEFQHPRLLVLRASSSSSSAALGVPPALLARLRTRIREETGQEVSVEVKSTEEEAEFFFATLARCPQQEVLPSGCLDKVADVAPAPTPPTPLAAPLLEELAPAGGMGTEAPEGKACSDKQFEQNLRLTEPTPSPHTPARPATAAPALQPLLGGTAAALRPSPAVQSPMREYSVGVDSAAVIGAGPCARRAWQLRAAAAARAAVGGNAITGKGHWCNGMIQWQSETARAPPRFEFEAHETEEVTMAPLVTPASSFKLPSQPIGGASMGSRRASEPGAGQSAAPKPPPLPSLPSLDEPLLGMDVRL